jgi:hypothetical protein
MDHTAIAAELASAAAADSRELDQICDGVALTLIDSDTEPPFQVTSADFATDAYLICADRYWFHVFHATPSVRTAARCARWLHSHVDAAHRTEVLEKWALGYAFVTRATVESATELAEATEDIVGADNSSGDLAYFTTLYHAGKLRANFHYEELRRFLDSSLLALAAGTAHRTGPLFVALESVAAFGSDTITVEYATRLFRRAWDAPQRSRHVTDLCLNGLFNARPFDAQGPMLRDHAVEALRDHPGDHMFHFRLATGQHLCGADDEALTSINTAMALLPATGARISHDTLQSQYMKKRDDILEGLFRNRWMAEQHDRWDRQERENDDLRVTLRASAVRSVELLAVFTAAIAFVVGSLQISLPGTLALRDRMWILLAFGVGLVVFALLIVGGTWFITRARRR